ncbi:Hsp20/alpha crystallin family protein [Virgibacillus ndiopensis]|uniref:Hsp20/alpha crystallin family protein n=1 Tax=Virgibacillus ndiopensis TaxID=2004408 RepID=UPI000C07B7F1|nr:Hsp20/alpha crystallin family protein [Virgibacillus ndiopensis]
MGSNRNNFPKGFDLDMTPFRDLMKRMDSVFNDSSKKLNSYFNLKPFWVDVYETESEVIVEAELPGYKRDQIQLEIIGNQLRITVTDSMIHEEKNDKTNYQNKEQSFQKMERIVTLPFTISEKDTTASFNDGILKISIPKRNSSRKFIGIDED